MINTIIQSFIFLSLLGLNFLSIQSMNLSRNSFKPTYAYNLTHRFVRLADKNKNCRFSTYQKSDSSALCYHDKSTKKIYSLYGDYSLDSNLLKEGISSPIIERLRDIEQYGLLSSTFKKYSYSRYSHSIGVLALLIRYNTSVEEQLAGLYHDASHTVGSHLGDYLFTQENPHTAYQDSIHSNFLEKAGIGVWLTHYGLKIEDIDPKNGRFKALEQDLPDICADRLEYNLQGGFLEKIINKEDIACILQNLKYENGVWYFQDIAPALKFTQIPLELMLRVWAHPYDNLKDILLAKVFNRALSLKIIDLNDIHYSTDPIVLDKLISSNDAQINELLEQIKNIDTTFIIVKKHQDHDIIINSKFRGIDPWVKCGSELKRLSAISSSFSEYFNYIKRLITAGWYIKCKK